MTGRRVSSEEVESRRLKEPKEGRPGRWQDDVESTGVWTGSRKYPHTRRGPGEPRAAKDPPGQDGQGFLHDWIVAS